MEYKKTLNMTKSGFPMRAGLPKREPEMLQAMYDKDLYHKMVGRNDGKPLFVLHDGPPYANGNIHVGHAVNKILKDMILKEKTLEGFQAPYVPGWDCHGMPIEVQIEKMHGKNLPVDKMQSLARAYALEQSKLQLADFKRLGVLGDWDNPYRTMKFKNEAEEIRALAAVVKKGYVYRGLKPVNWCFDCQSALAEAEVEYKDKKSHTIDVAFELADEDRARVEEIFGRSLEKPCFNVIWTTTPWTIPANQALNMNPELEYGRYDVGDRLLILGTGLAEAALERYGMKGEKIATAMGDKFELVRFRHPLWHVHEGFRRFSPVYLADYVDATAGTGIVHSAPAYGVDDFISCKKHGMTNDQVLTPVMGDGTYSESLPLFGGLNIWAAADKICETIAVAGNLLSHGSIVHSYMHCWRHKTPLIYRATAQWFVRMDAPDEDTKSVLGLPAAEKTLRQAALEGVKATKFFPEWGINRLYSMIENRPDWCISRLAEQLGKREDAALYAAKGQAYRNIFDREKGWFRPRRADGAWEPWPENARTTEWYGCIESNPYQQGWFVPHDVEGMVELMGGREAVLRDLTEFFDKTPSDMLWNDYYNHANEPVHLVPFLFNRLGQPWQTQKWTRHICEKAYADKVEGIVGNEDAGQMSAWYVLAAAGLHPACPGDTRMEITSPVFDRIELRLDPAYAPGGTFTVVAHGNSPSNVYIQRAVLNGREHTASHLDFADIAAGGTLELYMGDTPNTRWGI